MAKAKTRVPKKKSKRPVARKRAAQRAAPKKAKSKVRKTARGARKSTVKKKRSPWVAARKALKKRPVQPATVPVEDTIVDVVDEPAPGVVRVTEYETIRAIVPEDDADSDGDQD
jgi:hypothetical protein